MSVSNVTPLKSRINQPIKERVTLVVTPFERYSDLPDFLDRIYQTTHDPFDLIFIEGNSPDSVRSTVERRKKFFPNSKIIYSIQTPTYGAALNLALPHVRTRLVAFVTSRVKLQKKWLTPLLAECEGFDAENFFLNIFRDTRLSDLTGSIQDLACPEIQMGGFLTTSQTLKVTGEFNETLNLLCLGTDLGRRAKKLGIRVSDSSTLLSATSRVATGKKTDQKLFQYQWNLDTLEANLAYLKKTWAIEPDNARLNNYLSELSNFFGVGPALVSGVRDRLQTRINSAKIGARQVIHTFMSL